MNLGAPPVLSPRDRLEQWARHNAPSYWAAGIFVVAATATSLALTWLLHALGTVGVNMSGGVAVVVLTSIGGGTAARIASGPILRRFPWSVPAYRRALDRLDAGIQPQFDRKGWPIDPDLRAEALRQAREKGRAWGTVIFAPVAAVPWGWVNATPSHAWAVPWLVPVMCGLILAGSAIGDRVAIAVHALRAGREEPPVGRISEVPTDAHGRTGQRAQQLVARFLGALTARFQGPDIVVLRRENERRVEQGRGPALNDRVDALLSAGWEVESSMVALPDGALAAGDRSAARRQTGEPAMGVPSAAPRDTEEHAGVSPIQPTVSHAKGEAARLLKPVASGPQTARRSPPKRITLYSADGAAKQGPPPLR